jgi:regulator of nonsense transcripts 2
VIAGKRKSLARALASLFQLPLQLLPFYARITATLAQQYPDMGATVADAVLRSVKGTTKIKDATSRTLEPRIRSARYLCELCKFRVLDAGALWLETSCNAHLCWTRLRRCQL